MSRPSVPTATMGNFSRAPGFQRGARQAARYDHYDELDEAAGGLQHPQAPSFSQLLFPESALYQPAAYGEPRLGRRAAAGAPGKAPRRAVESGEPLEPGALTSSGSSSGYQSRRQLRARAADQRPLYRCAPADARYGSLAGFGHSHGDADDDDDDTADGAQLFEDECSPAASHSEFQQHWYCVDSEALDEQLSLDDHDELSGAGQLHQLGQLGQLDRLNQLDGPGAFRSLVLASREPASRSSSQQLASLAYLGDSAGRRARSGRHRRQAGRAGAGAALLTLSQLERENRRLLELRRLRLAGNLQSDEQRDSDSPPAAAAAAAAAASQWATSFEPQSHHKHRLHLEPPEAGSQPPPNQDQRRGHPRHAPRAAHAPFSYLHEARPPPGRKHPRAAAGSDEEPRRAEQAHRNSMHPPSSRASPKPAGQQQRRAPYRKRPGSRASSSLSDTRPSRPSCFSQLARLLMFVANLLFWSAGIALGAWGVLYLVEDHKYNLSQLLVFEPANRMSLLQLLAWSFVSLGCGAVLVGVCGCSAILKNSRWIVGFYIFLILAIFALDLATGLLAIIFQERLVANVRLRLANKLRSDYGVHASFTAAIDYLQTRFECCGLEGHSDYDQSLWRLQRLGGFEATVARTCCHLRNTHDDQAHVNPRPVNESMCQSTDVRFHQSYRYRKGCMEDLEKLIRQKVWTFIAGCGAAGAIILISLLFATCFCRSMPSRGSRKSSTSPTASQRSLEPAHQHSHRPQQDNKRHASNSNNTAPHHHYR